jgi:hypothetical protein
MSLVELPLPCDAALDGNVAYYQVGFTLGTLAPGATIVVDSSFAKTQGNYEQSGLHYDSTHHVLYFSAYSGGLWRLVTD